MEKENEHLHSNILTKLARIDIYKRKKNHESNSQIVAQNKTQSEKNKNT